MQVLVKVFRILIIASYLIGIVGISFSISKPEYFIIASIFVPLSFVLLMLFHYPHSLKFWVTLILIGFFGFIIEAIGTNTGLIFGKYTYGSNLGLTVIATPLNMAINWMMLTYLFGYVFKDLNIGLIQRSVLASLAMVLFDWIMEPVAIRLDLWRWEFGLPPFRNYVGWFLVSMVIFVFYFRFTGKYTNPMAKTFFYMHLLFFITLNLIFRLI